MLELNHLLLYKNDCCNFISVPLYCRPTLRLNSSIIYLCALNECRQKIQLLVLSSTFNWRALSGCPSACSSLFAAWPKGWNPCKIFANLNGKIKIHSQHYTHFARNCLENFFTRVVKSVKSAKIEKNCLHHTKHYKNFS